jgi:hypothetical protein
MYFILSIYILKQVERYEGSIQISEDYGMTNRLQLAFCIALLASCAVPLYAGDLEVQVCTEQAECIPADIGAYKDLIDKILAVDKDESLARQIKRIKDLDIIIEMLGRDEQDQPDFVHLYKELREYCQSQREPLYKKIVRLAAVLYYGQSHIESITENEKV